MELNVNNYLKNGFRNTVSNTINILLESLKKDNLFFTDDIKLDILEKDDIQDLYFLDKDIYHYTIDFNNGYRIILEDKNTGIIIDFTVITEYQEDNIIADFKLSCIKIFYDSITSNSINIVWFDNNFIINNDDCYIIYPSNLFYNKLNELNKYLLHATYKLVLIDKFSKIIDNIENIND